MVESLELSDREPLHGYQLGVVQEVLLASLAQSSAHAYELRARLALALGPLAGVLNEGQVYVTLGRLEKSGLIASQRVDPVDGRDRRVYELTEAGHERVLSWLEDVSWPKPAPAEFHLKLVAAAAAGLADPVRVIDRQRHELLLGLREAQRAALAEPAGAVAGLLLEGVLLRLQADLRWLEACAQFWSRAEDEA
ncbi:MAG: PadR family transcriptional regulator [Streptosporangiaceae bacterium]